MFELPTSTFSRRTGLLTFGVSVLLGKPLTAASTFTSVALLNMLIGPLNAFPWVLNGLIEASVSLKRVQKLMDVSEHAIQRESNFFNKNKTSIVLR